MQSQKPAQQAQEINPPISGKLSHPWSTFFFEAVLFSATIILGIFAGFRLMKFRQEYRLPVAEPVSFGQFVGAFVFATLIILLIPLLFKRKGLKAVILKSLFVFIIYFGGILTLGLWLGDIALILMALLVFGWLKYPTAFLHNFCLILAMAGLGANLGLSLTPIMVVAFLVLFSIYDFIAVYKTKHMVRMAKEMIRGGAILGFVAPQRLAGFGSSLKEVKAGGKFLILGGGDVVFPLLLVVALLPSGLFTSLVVALFGLIGLFFSFLIFVSQKIRAPIPALPPIALLSIFGYLLTQLF